MSGHLIGCAGALEHIYVDGKERKLPTSHKLALLAYADSADDRTHIGFAGYAGVRKWAVCSRSRAAELIADLCAWGLLEVHATARPGRRAEYTVFPGGCCEIHRPADEETTPDIDALARAEGIDPAAARRLIEAMNGSDLSDTSPPDGSGASNPLPPDNAQPTPDPVDNNHHEPERVQNGSGASDPFTTSSTSPLPPPASRQGRCAAHPAGRANCRGCGTTPRQLAAAGKKVAADRRRAAAAEQLDRDRQKATTAAAAPETAAAAVARARVAISAGRQRAQEKTR